MIFLVISVIFPSQCFDHVTGQNFRRGEAKIVLHCTLKDSVEVRILKETETNTRCPLILTLCVDSHFSIVQDFQQRLGVHAPDIVLFTGAQNSFVWKQSIFLAIKWKWLILSINELALCTGFVWNELTTKLEGKRTSLIMSLMVLFNVVALRFSVEVKM